MNAVRRPCPGALHRLVLLLLPAVLLWAGGCDTSFEAYEETDRAFSIFGYLDANADTQFVRIEPLQDSVFIGAGSLDARVTSVNVESGNTVVWNDSTFGIGAQGEIVHNFYTSADLKPEATYRFTVEGKRDGATSSAEVTLPPPFPEPYVINSPDLTDPEGPTVLLVRGVERLGAVRANFDYEACYPRGGCNRQQASTHHLADTTRRSDGTIEIEIDWLSTIPQAVGASLGTFYSFHVTVAAASEDWPEYTEENTPGEGPEGQPLPPPGVESNVENGAGFLGGVFTRTVEVPIKRP